MLCSVIGEISPTAAPTLKRLRLQHLEYVAKCRDRILFAGPARDRTGRPSTMIVIIDVPSLEDAEAFASNHPYVQSGLVFESIAVRQWSQVIPELQPGLVLEEIEKERLILSRQNGTTP